MQPTPGEGPELQQVDLSRYDHGRIYEDELAAMGQAQVVETIAQTMFMALRSGLLAETDWNDLGSGWRHLWQAGARAALDALRQCDPETLAKALDLGQCEATAQGGLIFFPTSHVHRCKKRAPGHSWHECDACSVSWKPADSHEGGRT